MEEEFRDVKGYEGLYQVSNIGRVKSLGNGNSTCPYFLKERILSTTKRRNYLAVTLSKQGKRKMYSLHRLVAETFIPNPNNYPCVNHLDENKQNNSVDNLEWCTYKYNCNYGTRNERISKALTKFQ